jgi:hypothetical protein
MDDNQTNSAYGNEQLRHWWLRTEIRQFDHRDPQPPLPDHADRHCQHGVFPRTGDNPGSIDNPGAVDDPVL